MKSNKSLLNSFSYACSGFFCALKTERNLRINLVAAIYVLSFSSFYYLTKAEFAVLLITLALVIFAELINTSLEATIDIIAPEYHPLAKKAKDVSAGGVLVFATFAVGVGVTLFWDTERISYILRYFTGRFSNSMILTGSLLLAGSFIFYKPSANNKNKKIK